MRTSSTFPAGSQRSLQSLIVSVLLLLVLVADPRLFVNHLPVTVGGLGGSIVRQARLWLVCLTICYTLNRLMETVLRRRIKRAWVYVLAWSVVIPVGYGMLAPVISRRLPGGNQNDVLLLTAILVVLAFAGTMFKRLADSVHRNSHYDHLTGLPNRVLLLDSLKRGIERCKRSHQKLAVCMLNIDHFKRINDALGHAGGDAVLSHVAKQLKTVIEPTDTLARISGDEFVVLLPNCETLEEADLRGRVMVEALSRPARVGELEVCVTASMGCCLFPDGAKNAPALLHGADTAMYDAKRTSRANVICSPALQRHVADRLELEEDLRSALQNNEFSLHYQPQIELGTGMVTGLEALLRWKSPKRGNVPPGDFIAIAEEIGLMIAIGDWTLQQACRDCVELAKATGLPLTMALNLSARQFGQRGLVEQVQKNLLESGLSPKQLELEITEQMLMVNSPHTLETLQAIRDLGVGIAIDDFGTGFSSFAYILQYQVDRLKIDQSFIAQSTGDPNATAIVRTVIAMAHGLNMKVVAEGVETNAQSEFLLRRRCDAAQGYLFARPLPKEEVAAAVERIVTDLCRFRPDSAAIPGIDPELDLAAPGLGLPVRRFLKN